VTNPWKATRTPALQPILAFLAFLALALSWSLGTPLLSGADEPEHVVKAAAAVRGEFSGPEHILRFGGWEQVYATPDYVEVTYHLPHSFLEALIKNNPGCYAFTTNVTATCDAKANKAKAAEVTDTDSSHMNYSPLYYLAVGWPSLILHGDSALYGMRIVSAIINSLMLAAAFVTSIRRRGAAAVGVLAAATPITVFFGAIVNPSGLEISSALLAWAAFLSLVRAEPGAPGMRRDRIMFAVAAAVLMLVRPLGPVWIALLAAAILGTSTGLYGRLKRTLRSPGVRWTSGLLAVSLILAGLWDVSENTMGVLPDANPHYTLAKGISLSISQAAGLLPQMVGDIGWLDTHVPSLTMQSWYGVIAVLLLVPLILGNRRERLVLLGLTALIVLFPILFQAYSGRDYGVAWQGRYTLPLAVGLPILGAEILVRRLSSLIRHGQVPRTLATVLGSTLAIAYLCQVWWAWRRFAVKNGTAAHLIPLHADWSPPIGWPAMLLLAVAGCGGLLLLLRHGSYTPEGPSGIEAGIEAGIETGIKAGTDAESGTALEHSGPDHTADLRAVSAT
jgi:hypothetical protein